MAASPLTHAHIEAQARLRALIAGAVGSAWTNLGSWDETDVDPFLAAAVPVVLAGQRQSVNLTNAYIARYRDRPPLGLDMAALTGAALRNGTDPREVYRRPFVSVWSALQRGDGTQEAFRSAVDAGLARATGSAAMDVQMAMRAAANAIGETDDNIYGYQRVADGDACAFCQEVDGAYIKSADVMPLHNHCGCGLEPLTGVHKRAKFLPDGTQIRAHQGGPLVSSPLPNGVSVHEHGELGPMLGSPDHNFTTPGDLK